MARQWLLCAFASGAFLASSAAAFAGVHVVTPHRSGGWLSPAARACKQRLYVSSFRLNYVDIYCTRGHNQPPIGQITAGINEPEGADADRLGNLYVTNTNANTVTEYARNSITPSFTYSTGLSAPAGVRVDRNGNVYVSSLSSSTVEEFPQGVNSPELTISGMNFPIDLAFDATGNLYVTYYTSNFSAGQINEYPPGSTQGTNLGITTMGPGGISIDASGNIVTADQRLPGVLVFPPGQTMPSETFGQTLDPDPVRFSRRGDEVFVGDPIENSVYVYAYPAGTLVDRITDGVDGPNGLAIDPPMPLK